MGRHITRFAVLLALCCLTMTWGCVLEPEDQPYFGVDPDVTAPGWRWHGGDDAGPAGDAEADSAPLDAGGGDDDLAHDADPDEEAEVLPDAEPDHDADVDEPLGDADPDEPLGDADPDEPLGDAEVATETKISRTNIRILFIGQTLRVVQPNVKQDFRRL